MDAEDDPSYVPDPKEETDDDEEFDDFDDCTSELLKNNSMLEKGNVQ